MDKPKKPVKQPKVAGRDSYYKQQFERTAANKARRAKKREEGRAAAALAREQGGKK